MEKTIGFIGGGRITRIFLQAFKNKGFNTEKIVVFDISSEVSAGLQKKYPLIKISTLSDASSQDIVFIALHPPIILDILEQVKGNIKTGATVISLAPKITIEKISSKLNRLKNVARMIPNATSYINRGYNPVCFSKDFNGESDIMDMLRLLGDTFITEESKLEAYAITSAMLPTYFWFQWHEMHQISRKMGLSDAETKETMEKTLSGAIEIMYQSGLNYEEVIDLIPVKPISGSEPQIKEILSSTLGGLFEKIKP